MKTPNTTVRLPLELKERVQKRAKDDHTNLTQVIIQALDRYLKINW